eukprot:6534414-Alexandrium_andersonii.AAC.1
MFSREVASGVHHAWAELEIRSRGAWPQLARLLCWTAPALGSKSMFQRRWPLHLRAAVAARALRLKPV